MTNTDELKKLIKKSGLKMQYIADYVGISRYSLLKKINNITEFKTSEVNKMCSILKIKSLKERDKIFFASKVD